MPCTDQRSTDLSLWLNSNRSFNLEDPKQDHRPRFIISLLFILNQVTTQHRSTTSRKHCFLMLTWIRRFYKWYASSLGWKTLLESEWNQVPVDQKEVQPLHPKVPIWVGKGQKSFSWRVHTDESKKTKFNRKTHNWTILSTPAYMQKTKSQFSADWASFYHSVSVSSQSKWHWTIRH